MRHKVDTRKYLDLKMPCTATNFLRTQCASMPFHESAEKGDLVNSFRIAFVYGALWAIGSSWSLAIRAVVVSMVSGGPNKLVLAEMGAAAITTVVGVGIAVLATRPCTMNCLLSSKKSEETRTPSMGASSVSQTLPALRRV